MSNHPLAVLLPYQTRWISDRAAVKVCEKSRRVGLSWCEAADRALAAAAHAGSDTWYIGYNREMAQEFIRDVAEWARRFQSAASRIEETALRDQDRDILAYQVRFASGMRVVALSSRPSNLRGKQGCAVIDEAAFHDDLPALLKAALAFLMWGGSVHVISTHNGAENPFNDLVSDIRAGRLNYSLHRVTFDDALGDGLFRRICEVQRREWSPEAERGWRRAMLEFYGEAGEEELFCVPRSSSGAFIPASLIEARMSAEIPVVRWSLSDAFMTRSEEARRRDTIDFCERELEPLLVQLMPGRMQFFGADFGRSADLTVVWPLEMTATVGRRTPFVLEMRNVPFRAQEQVLFYVADRIPRLVAGAIDARGNGQYLAEQARLRYGSRIEPVMLSEGWYREWMPRYKAAFEDGLISLPRDQEILSDHRALVVERGVPRVPERRIRAESGMRHGDSAIAAALAWHASVATPREYNYRPAPRANFFSEQALTREQEMSRDDDDFRPIRIANRRFQGWL